MPGATAHAATTTTILPSTTSSSLFAFSAPVRQMQVLQGFFTDKNHYEPGTWKGTRMITDAEGVTSGTTITLLGSDDGVSFWKVAGVFTDKAAGMVSIDFSPKGGPAGIEATWANSRLIFGDGNYWQLMVQWDIPRRAADEPDASPLQGFFMDRNHYKVGTWEGTRMITDAEGTTSGDVLTLLGSDDGCTFWKVAGTFTDKAAGKVTIDFSPKGGPAGIEATWAHGKLTFGDGNYWEKC